MPNDFSQPSILDNAEASMIVDQNKGAYPDFVNQDSLEELKHAIRVHVLIMNGPSQQLCVYCTKLIDILEESDMAKRNEELDILSYSITEAIALFLQTSIDQRLEKARSIGQAIPQHVKSSSDNIMITIGQSRGIEDKKMAKLSVLKSISAALKALSSFTKSVYPEILDVNGNPV